jgi:ribosome-associated toxin RatA of RatAB toxin-antitoxin module
MSSTIRKVKIHSSKETLFGVITDYLSYPKFLSTVKGARVLESGKNFDVVEFEAKVVKPFQYTLELTRKGSNEVSWKMIEGDFMRKNMGRWKLKEIGPKETEATYEIDLELSRLVPGFIAGLLVEQSLPQTLSEFTRRAETIEGKKEKKKHPKP